MMKDTARKWLDPFLGPFPPQNGAKNYLRAMLVNRDASEPEAGKSDGQEVTAKYGEYLPTAQMDGVQWSISETTRRLWQLLLQHVNL
jgi:hypothetical protein